MGEYKKPTFSTMFSGGELFGVGAQEAGYKHLWGIEHDDKIASVARLNGFNVLTGSVLDFQPYGPLRMINFKTGDILERSTHGHASPPCPNFSVAKTNGGETEADIALAESVALFIRTFLWDTFTLENVVAYRSSKSFQIIMKALQGLGYWTDVQNVNSADFGVPQTRNRLIVRASKNMWLKPYPEPVRWIGWYEAIEDLVDTLPDSQFAQWQLDRLPEEYKEFMLGNGTRSEPVDHEKPTPTITANRNQKNLRAVITRGARYKKETERGTGYRFGEQPAPTLLVKNTSMKAFLVNTKEPHGPEGELTVREDESLVYTLLHSAGVDRHKAFVLSGDNRGDENGMRLKEGDDPIFTIKANAGSKAPVRAYVLNGGNSNARSFDPRDQAEPHHTITASMDRTPSRAIIPGGRVVKMTIQALGRLQTVPDWYQGLTVKINGNGLPCTMAREIMKTFKNE